MPIPWRTRERRARIDLDARLAALDEALRLAEGRLDKEMVERTRAVRRRAAERLATEPASVVVALAGGTGSGKSSLFNAVVGAPLATVGARRPTTDVPLAWVVDGSHETERLLDWLGVDARLRAHEPADLAGLVLLDLPDHDSVATEHRRLVDRFVQRVDVLVWVADPLKYAQRALHEEYLRRMATHARVFLVVLNRIDELSAEDRRRCTADLRRLLDLEGLQEAALLTASARTGEGVNELRERLVEEVRRRRAVVERIAADVDALAAELLARCAATGPSGDGAEHVRDTVIMALTRAVGVTERAEAAGDRYRLAALARSRSLFARRWREPVQRGRAAIAAAAREKDPPVASPAAVMHVVLAAVAEAKRGLPHPWPTVLHETGRRAADRLAASLRRVVLVAEADAVRPRWWWTLLGATRTLLVVVAVTGFVWLAVLFAALYLQLPQPPTPQVGPLGLPTVLLFGGLAGGLLVGLLARTGATLGAARHARHVSRALRRGVSEVADHDLLEPLRGERAAHDALGAALRRAQGG
jgi:GTP-binding protein EngB required for normal cell division